MGISFPKNSPPEQTWADDPQLICDSAWWNNLFNCDPNNEVYSVSYQLVLYPQSKQNVMQNKKLLIRQ